METKIPKQFTDREVAEILRCDRNKLRHDRMHRRGAPFRKFGRLVRYDENELMQWMADQRKETVPGPG